jgi:flavin-dependent dehydrogenase
MKIAIVGGGTAGWIGALFILKAQPKVHEVVVIESSKIGIIGAGEGSTGLLVDLLENRWFNTGVDIADFVEKVDGTIKLGIRHKNWTAEKSSYFAPLDGSATSNQNPDLDFLDVLSKYGADKMHLASNIGQHFEAKQFPSYYALHFDGHKIGSYLKRHLEKEKITVIDSIVKDIALDDDKNVKHLVLEDNTTVEADFFIDSTGFSRLFSKKLEIDWVSYKENLPVDRAMPFLLDYEKNEVPEPLTTAHALSSGWMWDIPLQTRRGCGYVYDSSCITDEEAQKEIEDYLGKKITPIKFIRFEAGRSEVVWKNNCMLLGLSAAFAEPLEATSIHTTIIQMLVFCFEFLNKTLEDTTTKKQVERYNLRIAKMYDDIKDFLVLHYQGGRDDSRFWQSFLEGRRTTDFTKEILVKSEKKIPGIFQFDYYFGCIGAPLWNWILAGLGKITKEMAKKDLELYGYKK